jgi:hypothetical protein
MTEPPFEMTIGERVETIVNHYLRTGAQGGKLGTLVQLEQGWRVETAGYTFIVSRMSCGWQVTFKGWAAVEDELEAAAQAAWKIGRGRDVSRNYPVRVSSQERFG